MKNVAIVGLGLMGGSLALSLRRHGTAVRATDADHQQVSAARRAGIDARENLLPTLHDPFPDALVICTPVSAIAPVFREYHRHLAGQATKFFHAGGLQTAEHLGLSPAESMNLVGTHPLAGSHASGFKAARADLFDNCVVIVERKATNEHMRAAMDIWTAAGAGKILVEDAALHDARMPVVSHLPQLAATALALTIHERGYRSTDLGTGGRDATRLAASPFVMWVELLQRSRSDAVSHLSRLQWNVGRMRDAIAAEDWAQLEALWKEAGTLFEKRAEHSDEG
jgi:prephenate dehydrogenase